MVLWIRSRNKVPIISVKTKFDSFKKRLPCVFKNIKTMLIISFFNIEGIQHSSLWICTLWTNNQLGILKKGINTFAREYLLKIAEWDLVSFIMTMCQYIQWCWLHVDIHLWLIKKYLRSCTFPILLIWPYGIFFLFSRLNSAFKGQWLQDVKEIKASMATELKASTLEQFRMTWEIASFIGTTEYCMK